MTTTRSARGGRHTLLGVGVLVLMVAAGTAIAFATGPDRPGRAAAVAFAAGVSGISAIGGWLAARRPAPNAALAVAGVLAAAALRLALPLGALAWLSARDTPLRQAGAGGLLVAFYLALLATAILLHMMVEPPGNPDSRRSPTAPTG